MSTIEYYDIGTRGFNLKELIDILYKHHISANIYRGKNECDVHILFEPVSEDDHKLNISELTTDLEFIGDITKFDEIFAYIDYNEITHNELLHYYNVLIFNGSLEEPGVERRIGVKRTIENHTTILTIPKYKDKSDTIININHSKLTALSNVDLSIEDDSLTIKHNTVENSFDDYVSKIKDIVSFDKKMGE